MLPVKAKVLMHPSESSPHFQLAVGTHAMHAALRQHHKAQAKSHHGKGHGMAVLQNSKLAELLLGITFT